MGSSLACAQVYVQEAAAYDGGEALHAVFERTFLAATHSAAGVVTDSRTSPSMVRPAAWPLAATLEATTSNSQREALFVDAALLETCLAQAAASQVASLGNAPATLHDPLHPQPWLPSALLQARCFCPVPASEGTRQSLRAKLGDKAGNGYLLGATEGAVSTTADMEMEPEDVRRAAGWSVARIGNGRAEVEGWLQLAWAAACLLGQRAAAGGYGFQQAVALLQNIRCSMQVRSLPSEQESNIGVVVRKWRRRGGGAEGWWRPRVVQKCQGEDADTIVQNTPHNL